MKTLEQIFDIIESKDISIDKYEEDDKLCGYELNTYTDGGVNQIIFVDFRNEPKDPTNAEDFVELFSERIDSFDIDEEIELNRQDPSYRSAFTLTEAVKDFQEWKDALDNLVVEIS